MKITALGCGNAFSTLNGNNCFLLEDEQYDEGPQDSRYETDHSPRKLLIDAGWALPYMLQKQQIDIKSITDVYVSHAHSDHVGGLEFMAFSRYDFVNKPQFAPNGAPYLIGNSTLLKDLWEKSLRGGMESLEGIDCSLETFFKVKSIEPHRHFQWCGWDCRLVQQIHIMTGSMITNTFGLIMTKYKHPTVYFVTDSQHCSPHQLEVFYKEADLIFQDCELIGVDAKNYEMKFCSHVHANYGQLAGLKGSNSTMLPHEIRNKMWLTHYQDFMMLNKDFFGNDALWDMMAKGHGFQGFVKVGQTWEV
jgi:ribonuclease BN (tRNA processing enzyme)